MGLVDDGLELLVGELQEVVAHHDLDEVGPVLDLVAHGAPHLVGAGGLPAAPVGMAAGLDDRLGDNQQARAREHPLFHRLLGEGPAPVHPQVAHQGDSRSQAGEHVGGRLVGADLGRVSERLGGQVVDAVPGQVRVAVDQPGQDGPARFHHRAPIPCGPAAFSDRRDHAVLKGHMTVFDHLAPDACDHPAPQRHRRGLPRGQVLQDRLELPGWCFGHAFGLRQSRFEPAGASRRPGPCCWFVLSFLRCRARRAPGHLHRGW